MKTHFIRELEPNQVVTSFFIVHSKEVRLKKTGEPYLCLTLADRTGQLDAKMWDGVPEVADTFDRDDFVKVKGLIQVFRNKPQMTVHKLRRVEESEVNFADYFPHTEKNIDELWAAVRAAVSAVRNEHLRALLDAFLDDEEVARRFRVAPAAKSLHHARLGGLLEHVVSLIGLCRLLASHYDFIDLDLLITAAVLHDLGKIYELHYERSFGYSTEGQLLGHMIIVLDMLQAKAAAVPGFPPKLKTLVEHLILSHHGHYEFGSPKLPMFPEALLFHYLDDLDSKLESMRATIASDPNIEGHWTMYNASLDRPLLKKEKFLSEEPEKTDRPPAQADGKTAVRRGEATPERAAASANSSASGAQPELAPAAQPASPVRAPAPPGAPQPQSPPTAAPHPSAVASADGSATLVRVDGSPAGLESTVPLGAPGSADPPQAPAVEPLAAPDGAARTVGSVRPESPPASGSSEGSGTAQRPGASATRDAGAGAREGAASRTPAATKRAPQTVFGELLQSALKKDGAPE